MSADELNRTEADGFSDSNSLAVEKEKTPWKVIIADDEPEIHSITRLVLDDFEFEDRKLHFLSAYSGKETIQTIQENPDTALVLLDVVMESEEAGLNVVRFIREELRNPFVRIILRTGQPGQAPEKHVVSTYDINDYKEKTELTSDRLYTTVMASLRAYRDLLRINRNRRSLEQIVATSPRIMRFFSLKTLASEVLQQLSVLLSIENDHPVGSEDSLLVIWDRDQPYCLAGRGKYRNAAKNQLKSVVDNDVKSGILGVLSTAESWINKHVYCVAFEVANGARHALYIESGRPFEQQDHELLDLFCTTAQAAFENIHLNKEIEETQKEIIDTLGEMIECRFREMGNHVRRVSEYAYLLAQLAGLSEKDAETLKFAAPMHDIGKIGIPDDILKKPGRLTTSEFEIMKRHTTIGYNLLKSSDRKILKNAAVIALEHHERWDGKGYPQGLAGEQINMIGRITRLVDVFDALSNRRIYKPAWPVQRILEYLREESGRQFDPQLVNLFISHIDEFLEIKKRYPDEAIQR